MSTAKKEPGLAMLVIVLALICLVVAALLGLVNQVTAPAIAANTEKTIQDSLKVVLPADSYEKVEYDGGDITLDTGTVVPVLAVYQAGEEGYVVETNSPNGFGGAIDMMAGINSAGDHHPRGDVGLGLQGDGPRVAGTVCRRHGHCECHQGWRYH